MGRSSRGRALGLAVIALALFAPAAASAAPTLLSPNATASEVNAYGGVTVYSRLAAPGSWVLVSRRDGRTGDVPGLAPAAEPIDADLGPGPGGGVVAVYLRCATETRCRLFELDLATNAEHPIALPALGKGCRVLGPSVHGASIALAEVCPEKARHDALLLRSGGRWRTLRRFGRPTYPADTELSATDVVAVVVGGDDDDETEVLRQPLTGGASRVLASSGPAGDGDPNFSSLTIAGPWVYFVVYESGEDALTTAIARASLTTRPKDIYRTKTAKEYRYVVFAPAEHGLIAGYLDSLGVDAGSITYAVRPREKAGDVEPTDPPVGPGVFLAPLGTLHFALG